MQSPEIVGRYALYGKIASGGMATVHIGRLLGPVGFSRTVAIKRMHPHFTGDPEFVSMFLDEARLAARIRHPNVVSTLDVVASNGELFLVLDYVQGETLAVLGRRAAAHGARVPVPIVMAILSGVLHGLHAAHEAKNERGEPLGIVHRDISPQNVMVGIDGVSRVLDFGVAKAAGRLQTTQSGKLKGKLAYMPPEQIRGGQVTRRCDVYAAAVVLWETLAGRRLFQGEHEGVIIQRVLSGVVAPPSAHRPEVPPELDAVVMRGLARDPAERFATAREMASALEAAAPVAIAPTVGAWVDGTAADTLSAQAERIAAIESASDISGSRNAAEAMAFVDLALAGTPAPASQTDVEGTDTSASKASALSVVASGSPSTSSHVRRNVVVAAVTMVIAVSMTALIMHRRTDPGVASSPGAPSALAAASASPATAPLPPATGADPTPPAPPPSSAPSVADSAAAKSPIASASSTPKRAWGARRPAGAQGPVATPHRPSPVGKPAYDPLDHL